MKRGPLPPSCRSHSRKQKTPPTSFCRSILNSRILSFSQFVCLMFQILMSISGVPKNDPFREIGVGILARPHSGETASR